MINETEQPTENTAPVEEIDVCLVGTTKLRAVKQGDEKRVEIFYFGKWEPLDRSMGNYLKENYAKAAFWFERHAEGSQVEGLIRLKKGWF